MSKIVSIQRKQPVFFIFWHLTDFCNWECSYCPDQLHSGNYAMGRRAGYPTNEEIDRFIDHVIENLQGKPLWLNLSGGEPTVHPMFSSIIQRLKPYGIIGVNSNGSRPLKWWKSLPELPSGFTFSLHPEYVDKMPQLNELYNYLADKGVDLQFNLMCDPNHWDTVTRMYDMIDQRFNNYIICLPVHDKRPEQNRHMTNYSTEQRDWIRQHQLLFFKNNSIFTPYTSTMTFDDGKVTLLKTFSEPKLKLLGLNQFNGWSCNAGVDSIDVNYDGQVWSSICKHKNLGRLDNFKLLDEPGTCPFEICIHPADLAINKRAPGHEKNS